MDEGSSLLPCRCIWLASESPTRCSLVLNCLSYDLSLGHAPSARQTLQDSILPGFDVHLLADHLRHGSTSFTLIYITLYIVQANLSRDLSDA
jgi:hypothetical protein